MRKTLFGRLKRILPAAAIAVIWLGALSSCSRPDAAPLKGSAVAPGTKNKFFTAISSNELRSADGSRFEVVTGADGGITSINAIRDNVIQPIRCECHSACRGSSCNIKYEEETGWTKVTCLGQCYKSEGTSCGGCEWVYPTPGGGDSGSSTPGEPMNPGIVNAPAER